MSGRAFPLPQPSLTACDSQLLDLLLDVNQSVHIPLEHRYELGSTSSKTPDATQVPGLDTDNSPSSSHDSLSSIKRFQSLLKTPHTSLAILEADNVPEDLQSTTPPTYYTTNHEFEYLESLDKSLGVPPTVPRTLPSNSGERLADIERENDFNIRNPVSVYNWLRKHQPQVFLQDHEASADKMTKTGDKRGAGKRASIAAAKATPEFVDDDGYALGADVTNSSSKNGRKRREEDSGYRPKGGANKSGKRKREDDPMGSKKIRKKGP